MQEIKCQEDQIPEELLSWIKKEEYHYFIHSAEKKGYSGVMTIVKEKPLNIIYGLPDGTDREGRLVALEFEENYLINGYFPNAQHGLLRLDFKIDFNQKVWKWIEELKKQKAVIICGDFNVAHQEIDLKNPKANEKNPGFCPEEREDFNGLLKKGWVDSFRYFYPATVAYTWWSYRSNARKKNIGWRIDYYLFNEFYKNKIKNAGILPQVMGSDHCPVFLECE